VYFAVVAMLGELTFTFHALFAGKISHPLTTVPGPGTMPATTPIGAPELPAVQVPPVLELLLEAVVLLELVALLEAAVVLELVALLDAVVLPELAALLDPVVALELLVPLELVLPLVLPLALLPPFELVLPLELVAPVELLVVPPPPIPLDELPPVTEVEPEVPLLVDPLPVFPAPVPPVVEPFVPPQAPATRTIEMHAPRASFASMRRSSHVRRGDGSLRADCGLVCEIITPLEHHLTT